MEEELKPKIPMYVEAYEEIHKMINTGIYKPGEKLPSETELSKLLNISRSTLRQALFLLREDNLILNHQGKGNYVIDNEKVINKKSKEKSIISEICNTTAYDKIDFKVSFQLPTTKHQNELNINHSNLLGVLEVDYFVKNQEVADMIIFTSYDYLKGCKANLNDGEELYKFILEIISKKVTDIQSKISVISPREKLNKKFNLSNEEQLIVFDEVFYIERGKPFISVKTYFMPKYFNFNINRK